MCGRTSCHLPRDVLTRACAYRDGRGQQRLPEWRDPDKYCPSYNKSPQSSSPVLLSRQHFHKDADSWERVIAPMRWGLVPGWFKEADLSKMPFNITNCRSDTILEKRSFKVPLGKGRRCVVLADGFYEWRRSQVTSESQPYFIYFPQGIGGVGGVGGVGGGGAADSPESWEEAWGRWRLLTMAGIFDCWEPPEGGAPLYSYSIITVEAGPSLSDIHPRMPAILDGEEAVSKWLDFGEVSTQEALKLIQPTENVAFHPVSSVVNNARNNSPECVAPLGLAAKKEPKASGSSQMMRQWLATGSPKKEDPGSPQKGRPHAPRWTSQFLPGSPLPARRGSPGLLERWLKRPEDEPQAKRPRPGQGQAEGC